MLTGVGVGAAVGGLTGALVGLGIPEFEAKRYEGLVRGGRILLSVHADDPDWRSKATAILEATGAEDIASARSRRATSPTHESRCDSYPAGTRRSTPREEIMLETIAVLLIVLWLLGMVSSYTLGGFIHILLVIALVVIVIRVIQGRRVV